MLARELPGGAELSGGQWQRLALARALFATAHGARVLVLDEPTAALDVRAEARFYQRFHEITAGLTTLVISHRFATVRRASRIYVLDGGRDHRVRQPRRTGGGGRHLRRDVPTPGSEVRPVTEQHAAPDSTAVTGATPAVTAPRPRRAPRPCAGPATNRAATRGTARRTSRQPATPHRPGDRRPGGWPGWPPSCSSTGSAPRPAGWPWSPRCSSSGPWPAPATRSATGCWPTGRSAATSPRSPGASWWSPCCSAWPGC